MIVYKTRIIYPETAHILYALGSEITKKYAILYCLCDARPRLRSEVANLLGLHYNTLTELFRVMVQESMIEVSGDFLRITGPGSLLIRQHRARIKELYKCSLNSDSK